MTKVITAFFLILLCNSLYAQNDLYTGASQESLALISKADELISHKKYKSAFDELGTENTDPYIVAKKVEICIHYFVQSINHKMFALKDLEQGETLDKLRSGTGTWTLYPYDPPEIIGKLIASGVRVPVLYKALGDYYYDVSLRYSGRWLESDDEIAKDAVKNYKIAFEAGIQDPETLTNYADKATHLGDFETALKLYKLAYSKDKDLYNAPFNIAYVSLQLGKFDDALEFGKISINRYSDDLNYKMDAILLCADACRGEKKYGDALGFIDDALKISKLDYRVFQKQAYIYFEYGKTDLGGKSLDSLFALSPANPGATQLVMKILDSVHQAGQLQPFFDRNIKNYSANPEAEGNLLFHNAYFDETNNDKAEALKLVQEAKSQFQKAGKYDGDIKEAIEAMIKRNS